MKDAERKARIRAMLQAEGLGGAQKAPADKAWGEFRQRLRDELQSEKPPRLAIRSNRPGFFRLWQLVPAFALLLLGMLFYFRNGNVAKNDAPVVAEKKNLPAKTIRTMKKGDVFVAEKRRIRFSGGDAKLSEEQGRYVLEATELRADFRLKQKTDLKIEHPLIRVTVTGTEFSVDATAAGGSLNLTEGSLRIDLKTDAAAPVLLTAPARFEFGGKFHRVKKTGLQKDRILYRYEMKSGEVFFAHQIGRPGETHKLELLGGKTEVIRTEDILRFAPVAEP